MLAHEPKVVSEMSRRVIRGLRLTRLMVVAAGLAAPSVAGAAEPRGGWYTHEAAATQRPQVSLDVSGDGATLMIVGGVRCLRAPLQPDRWFMIRRGQFRVTIRLGPRGTPRNVRDQLVIEGRWTSPYTVSGRLRVVLTRALVQGRRVYCDSRWQRWRSGSVNAFGVRSSAPLEFAVPGTLVTTVTVYNNGDYDSRKTELAVLPESLAKSDPARPAPVISTTRGSCRWPTRAAWAHWTHGLDYNSTILCNLGTVRARTSATITISQSWSVAHCAYDEYGNGSLNTGWDTFLSSPLLPSDPSSKWHHYPGSSNGGLCPSLMPDE